MSTETIISVANAPTFRRQCGIFTLRQRDLERRNEQMRERFRQERDKGSDISYIYSTLARLYGLSTRQVGTVCRAGRKEAMYA